MYRLLLDDEARTYYNRPDDYKKEYPAIGIFHTITTRGNPEYYTVYYTVFDNRSGEMFMEEFNEYADALMWILK